MAIDVILPRVDMDMASAKVAIWHVKNGDVVAAGQLLFDIETDKAAMEIDSPGSGVIQNISGGLGIDIPVGTVIAQIYQPGEAIKAILPVAAEINALPAKEVASATLVRIAAASVLGKILATPLARKLAKSKGVDLTGRVGSGPRGRIVAADVAGFVVPILPVETPKDYRVIPLDGMRRTIAARLTLSKQTIPHFYLNATCDLTHLQAMRERLNLQSPKAADKSPVWKLSVNDFIIKALAHALQQVPAANVTWGDDCLHQYASSDIGVAVAVAGGLFTPVIRNAETKTLSQISIGMKDLGERARSRKLLPSEYHGGTTAISNLGMFGIESFSAIINPPHASILAVGAGVDRYVPVNGQPTLRSQMACTLSCDHRAIDGAVGAQLLQVFKAYVEEPALLLT